MLLLAIGDVSASQGIGGVFVAFFGVIAAMALIYAVLYIMDKAHNKKAGKNETNENEAQKDQKFSEILEEKLNNNDKKG